MEIGTVRRINIDAEMQASYLDYAMSVIVARALPDVRDGLKPVHRRILYAMHDLGMSFDKPYKKSARIVGEVLGKYHPHGDAAVYEAMVRMAQDFSLRYPLVDGQGNFGSIDGDNAAAMRYTEARLAAIAGEMLADIDKDTVDWVDNFDGTLREPSILPAALPNLVVNGSSGIAVGMSTNIPPHNLGEVCDALFYLLDNFDRAEDVSVEDLLRFIPGPDFPTGGVIYRFQHEGTGSDAEQVDVIANAYAIGRGSIVMQAKAHIEDMSRSRSRIVVTELPYQSNKTNLLERIAELVRDGRLEGITDLRDESDRTGMRICIEMTRTVEPRQVLADLYKLTPLQTTFGVSLLALVDGEPRLLSLKRLLMHFIEHRQEVIMRRSHHDLEKAKQREHILTGLLRALDILDEVIALIRKSRTAETARQNLREQLKFTELQAQAILDMQLRRLAALERRKLLDEYREVVSLIRDLEALLASPKKVLDLIRQNLTDLKSRYSDARRTQIADRTKGDLTTHDLLPDEDVRIFLKADGILVRQRQAAERRSPLPAGGGVPLRLLSANTRDDLYLFSARGQAARVSVHQIPEEPGIHFADVSGFTRRDRVVGLRAISKTGGEEPAPGYLLLGTSQGKVKRVSLADLLDQGHTVPQVIGLDDADELAWTDVSPGAGEILLVTGGGQAIRFAEEDVRSMGLAAGGIGGIKLPSKGRVVAGIALNSRSIGSESPLHAPEVAIVTSAGYGKRVPLAEFPVQGRNGQGVVAAKLAGKAVEVHTAGLIAEGELLVCVTAGGKFKVLPRAEVPAASRATQGKPLLALGAGDRLLSVFVVSGRTGTGPDGEEDDAEAPIKAKPGAKSNLNPGRVRKAPSGAGVAAASVKGTNPAGRRTRATSQNGAASPHPPPGTTQMSLISPEHKKKSKTGGPSAGTGSADGNGTASGTSASAGSKTKPKAATKSAKPVPPAARAAEPSSAKPVKPRTPGRSKSKTAPT